MALPIRTSGTWTGTVQQTRIADGGGPIDPGAVVITVPPTSPLVGIQPGEAVTLTTTVTAGWEAVQQAVGGREWVVRDGVVTISPHPASADEIHPRSAVGLTADGRLILATVDGRETGVSEGVRLTELAELMLERGAVQAINLDGGGSSTLVVRRAGTETPVIANKPSDGVERPVTNSIQVVSTMPTGPLAVLNVKPTAPSIYRNQTIDFSATGMDAGYNPVPIQGGQVSWSLTAPIGTIDAGGHFVATSPGTAQVVATVTGTAANGQVRAAQDVTGSAPITVLSDTSAPVATAPKVTLPVGRGIGTGGVPVTVAWDAATDEGSGVASYELQRSVDGHAWTTMPKASPAARTSSLTLPRNRTYQFQVRAVDVAGNVGAWRPAGTFKLTVTQEIDPLPVVRPGHLEPHDVRVVRRPRRAIHPDDRWHRPVRVHRHRLRLGRGREPGPWRGAGLDRRQARRARSTPTARRRPPGSWSSRDRPWASGHHTVEIRALGTPGHPRVDIDALVTMTPVAGTTPSSSSPPPPGPSPTPTPSPGPSPTPTPTPTPAPSGASRVLVGAGDIASCGLTADTATAKLVAGIAGTVFAAGDEAYESGSATEFKNCYDPTWGPFRDRTNPVPGNHEYVTAGAAGYFSYFGSRAGTAGAGWYAYRPRHVAHLRAQFQLRRRRLRPGLGPGAMAARGSCRQPSGLRARVLAPPAVQLRPARQRH